MNRITKVHKYQGMCEEFNLYFYGYSGASTGTLTHALPLDDVVMCVIGLMESFDSQKGTSEPWTESGSSRSSIDIYRHILGLGIETTLPQVMASIFRNQKNLGGGICGTAGRRVFCLSSPPFGIGDKDGDDEYGLNFHEWEDIDKEFGLLQARTERLDRDGSEDSPYGFSDNNDDSDSDDDW